MTFNDIESALGQRLAGMSEAPPIAWPNADFTPNGAYLEFRHSPTDRIDETYDSAGARQIGIALITVVETSGGFTGNANALAQQVASRFPKGLRMSAGDGTVLIYAPSAPTTGFQDGAYWRQPVSVRYVTEGGAVDSAESEVDVSSLSDGIERVGNTLRVDIDNLPSAPGA